MKNKYIAILSLIGVGVMLTGCNANISTDNFRDNIEEFTEHVSAYNQLNTQKANKKIFNKYTLSVSAPIDAKMDDNTSKIDNTEQTETSESNENVAENIAPEINNEPVENAPKVSDSIPSEKSEVRDEIKNDISTMDIKEELTQDKVSTLYSLSGDIENECDDFSTLKENITNAIVETQNLIDKVNKKEIELTAEQRMFITEQSRQLKNLGRQLSHVTSELNINLSDLSTIMRENGDIDALSLKYLVVLDNLINGNEMLENGLHSLNMINNLINMNRPLPPDKQGRIIYGYQKNNEPPIIKDYLIDNNGKLEESQTNNDAPASENAENTETTTNESEQKFKSNIDTYRGNVSNIDTFFNTALLDNEFMYGNNRYGYGGLTGMGYGGGFNPYVQNQYVGNNETQNTNDTTTGGVDNTNNTQNVDTIEKEADTNKPAKKKGLIKNIDTYRNENTPTLSSRINNVKQSISGFFGKFSKPREQHIKNPIAKFED